MLAAARLSASTGETNSASPAIRVLSGPATVDLKNIATLRVPAGFLFTDADGARALLKKMGNPVSGREVGFLAPASTTWCAVFEFNDLGYLKGADRDKLDVEAMLGAIHASNHAANEQRETKGMTALHVLGWDQEPKYNAVANTFEWAIRAESGGQTVINYNWRLLGRSGVIEVTLLDQRHLASSLSAFKELLSGLCFKPGESYADYHPGDKVAKVGLASLVTSGESPVEKRGGAGVATHGSSSRFDGWWWLGWTACVPTAAFALAARTRKQKKPARPGNLPAALFHVVARANTALMAAGNEGAATGGDGLETKDSRRHRRKFRADQFYFDLIKNL